MAHSPEVAADIRRRSLIFGGALGVVCLPAFIVIGMMGACCPFASLLIPLTVSFWSGVAGFLASMFLQWGQVPHESALNVGVSVGARTGLIASGIGAGTFLVLSSIIGLVGVLGLPGPDAALVGGLSFLMKLFMCFLSLIPGTITGVLGGVIGAAIKR